jgi:hypothetical protein
MSPSTRSRPTLNVSVALPVARSRASRRFDLTDPRDRRALREANPAVYRRMCEEIEDYLDLLESEASMAEGPGTPAEDVFRRLGI